jgi:single-stranded-DNA-specific exonuclease
MVYKFCSYIDKILGTEVINDYLDLVALGLIADMVDIKDFETKRLITKGLENINNPFFKLMVQKNEYSLGSEITPIGVAFYVAPYINATIRTGSADEKYLLFRSMLETDGNALIPSTKRGCKGQLETPIEQACRNTTNHKKKQTTLRDELVELILTQIEKENLLDNKILVIKIPKEKAISKTITGLVCNELASTFQRPTLLLNEKEETWEGSCRNYSNSFLPSLRDFLLSTELVEYASGHNNALGTSIKKENVELFIKTTNTLLKHIDCKTPIYKVDFIFKDEFFDGEIISLIKDGYKLWGQEIPEPYIALEKLKVTKNKNLFLILTHI